MALSWSIMFYMPKSWGVWRGQSRLSIQGRVLWGKV